jgi:hypothetical protein
MVVLLNPKREYNVPNLNDKVKILDLLNSIMSLVEVELHYGKNESGIHSVILNSMHR